MAPTQKTSLLTVADAVERYSGALSSRGAAANTVTAYAHDLHHFTRFRVSPLVTSITSVNEGTKPSDFNSFVSFQSLTHQIKDHIDNRF